MNTSRLCELRAVKCLLFAGLVLFAPFHAQGQFASLLETTSRYAGNGTGTPGYSGDTGAATATSLDQPYYAVFDSLGNLFVSDTANNCVRKIDTSGNISTVAGLRVSGGSDTCNTTTNATPTPAQGLLAPTGLAIDSANNLYISDSQHNCVRSLAYGAVDTYANPLLTTVAGTCTDTASVTPVPNGLAVDSSQNLYISIQDSFATIPVNQVLLHLAGASATAVCYLAGQPSANVPNACAGITNAVTLAAPSALAFDVNGNLFVADTRNNCVREIAGLTTTQTVVGQCLNDSSGNPATALDDPYGLAFSPTGDLYIGNAGTPQYANVVSYSASTGALTLIAGTASANGPYFSSLDGLPALESPLGQPRGLTTDTSGNVYVVDYLQSIVHRLSTGTVFAAQSVGVASATQAINFSLNQSVNLSATTGPDYTIASNTCTGPIAGSPTFSPLSTCKVVVAFTPSLPGQRNSPLQLKDSLSGNLISVALEGLGNGALSLFTPGTVNTIASGLRTAIAVSVDSAGNAYVLEQGNGTTTADVLLIPAGGGATRTVVSQGSNLIAPTAMAVDGAGTIFITDASTQSVARFGADGSVNTTYAIGIVTPTAIAVDAFDNLYVAQGGTAHNVIEIYAGGARRTIAGSGSTASANGVSASSALFVEPGGLVLGPNNTLSIADSGGRLVYTISSAGVISIIAGNGTTSTTDATQATGTALLTPVGLSADAAGDVYISDEASNRVYEVYPVQSSGSNIATVLGTGTGGYTGDGGSAVKATIQGPLGMALDSAGDAFVVDGGNSALREVTHPLPPTVNFGDVIIGTTSPATNQGISNAGNLNLAISLPFSVSDSHFATTSTTCGNTLLVGGVCTISYTFTPTVLGPLTGTSSFISNSYNSPQTIQLTGYGLYTQNLPYTLAPQTEVYGQPFTESATINLVYPDLVPTGTITYSIGGKTLCTISGSFPSAVNCPAVSSGLGVGTYTVVFTYTSGDASYFSTTGTTTLTITPAALTVTPANATKLYGAPIPALSTTITGAVNGDVFLATTTTTATAASPVGTYPITATLAGVGLASLSNYTVTYNTGTLTVGLQPLTVTVNNATRAYGQANPTFTDTITGAANGDSFTTTYATPATITSPVGVYPITATITGTNLANYTVTYVAGTLTVTQAPLTVTVANATRMYGAANPTFSGTITGALNGDTFTNSFSTPATAASPVGTYPINDSVSGAAAGNYAITVVLGTLTITPTTAPVTIAVNNATRLYGAANPAFSSTVSGTLNGDTFTISYSTTATVSSPIGSYPIVATASGAALANYANVTTTNGTLTVTPAPLTITVANATRQYATANPTFSSTATGALNGDTFTNTYATTATIASPVGTYPITDTVSGAATANYTITVVPGVLTITPTTSPLVFTANNATRVYGAANPTFTGTATGALNGDTFTVTYTTTATAASPVGSYPITPVVSGVALANYANVSEVNGTLTITKAPVTVTVNNATRAYGAANPAFSSTVTGALNGDTFTNTYTTTATAASPVGNYPITDTVSGAAAANYTITVVPGTLTITAATLTVTANSATRLYGAANPTFTGTITGLQNGDTVTATYATSATAASPVGSYPIVPTVSGAALSNYTLVVANGTLTISPAALTVTVANATRAYGAANPTFSSTISGALNGDTFTNNFSTTATVTSPVGTYPITDTLTGAAAANYTVTVVPGTLTITQATVSLTVTANNATRLYGAANPAFSSTITGALNGDTFTVTYSTTATAASPVGSYPIVPTVSGSALSNYTLVTANGTLSVTPAPLTVTANNATRVYGAANPAFAGTVTGLQNGDTVTATYATTATATSPAGTYPITPTVSGAVLSNYTLVVANGTLTITPAALTVTVANATRAYGAANPTFTAILTGALNGDTFTNNFSTTATVSSPVGTYPITDTLTGAAAANYTVTIVPGTLTITPAVVVLTVTANNATRLYGAANPAFSSTVSGALNGDTFTVTYATTATAASPVGSYPIVPTVSGPAVGNYTVVTNNGTLSVTPAPLSVAANNATRMYGAANPTFTGTITGLLNGDTVAVGYTTTATVASPVGSYPIVPTVTGAALANYTLTTANGTLTITAATAPLTVTVNNATRAFGAANPTFTSTITGLLNGDTVTVTYATTATVASAPGAYPITATVSGAAAANYNITVVPGTLTVTLAPTAITLASSGSPSLLTVPVTFTATVTSAAGTPGGTVNFFNGTTLLGSSILNSAGVATFVTSTLPAGSDSITATYLVSTDFASSSATLTQVVSPGSFTITVNPPSDYIRGPGTTTYTVSATSTNNFSGPVTLTCTGLPADATCTFANPSLTLYAGSIATTTLTIVNTESDARLLAPGSAPGSGPRNPGAPGAFSPASLTPLTAAAVFPFELTGFGVFLAGLAAPRRRRQSISRSSARSIRPRLLLLVVCTLSMLTLAGCACFTSVYKTYTVTITGTSSVAGTVPQSATLSLSVGEQ